MLEAFIIEDDEPPSDDPPIDLDSLVPRIRGNVCREFITSSYSSSNGRSEEEVAVVAVEVGDKEGLWTISCRNAGNSGAGVSILCSSGDEREEDGGGV